MGWDDIAVGIHYIKLVNKCIVIKCYFSLIFLLQFDYNYNLKIWFISSNGTLNCKLNRLRLNVIFYVDFSKDELVLQDLQFTEVG